MTSPFRSRHVLALAGASALVSGAWLAFPGAAQGPAGALENQAEEGSRVSEEHRDTETPSEPAPSSRTAPAGGEAATQGEPRVADLPSVNLEERVPANWFRNDSDRFPLRPERWRRRMPRRCRTQGGYIDHCQGERRVAIAPPEAQARAERLGLGRRETARWLMHKRPFPEWMEAVRGLDPNPRLTFPVPGGHMGRGFGRVRRGSLRRRPHKGIDIGAPEGTEIVAARGGLVVYADNRITGYGNSVMLLHADGFTTFYAHGQETLVGAGEYVRRGQPIARVGETGFAWAPHLHFEWRQRGWPRDPARHLLPDPE